jgi:hypothetical protein
MKELNLKPYQMKITLFLAILLYVSNLFSQTWNYSYYFESKRINPNGHIIDQGFNSYILSTFQDSVIVGNNKIYSNGGKDLLITKYDNVGNLLWHKHFGGSGNDIGAGIDIGDNSIAITGNFTTNLFISEQDSIINYGDNDVFIITLDVNGNIQNFTNATPISNHQLAQDIKFDNEDNLVIAGNFYSQVFLGKISGSNSDTIISDKGYGGYASKFDNSLNYINSINFISSSSISKPASVEISSDGYYIAGNFKGEFITELETLNSVSNSIDVFVLKTQANFSSDWLRTISGSKIEALFNISKDEFENIFILGSYESVPTYIDSTDLYQSEINVNNGGKDVFLAKFNRSGNLLWHINRGGIGNDSYNDLAIFGDIIYTGGIYSEQLVFNNDTLSSSGGFDGFLAALNSFGDPIAGTSIAGSDDDENISFVEIDNNLNAYVTGYFESSQVQIGDSIFTNEVAGSRNLFFAKYSHPFKTTFTAEQNASCNGMSDGMLTTTPYFGVPPYTYAWSHDPGLNDSVATNLEAGAYSVTITDSRDSTAIGTAHVGEPQELAVTFNTTDVTCHNGNDGALDISVSGGNGGYEYTWDGGVGLEPKEEDQTGLYAGTYYLTITDLKGCTKLDTVDVLQPDKITFNPAVTSSGEGLSDGAIDLTPGGGTPPYNFAWSGPSDFTATTEDISGIPGGTYNVTISHDASCSADTSVFVPEVNKFLVYISNVEHISCFGAADGSATVSIENASGQESYTWYDSTKVNVVSVFASASSLDAGKYYVKAEDEMAHVGWDSVVIQEPDSLYFSRFFRSQVDCNGDNSGYIDVEVTGGTPVYTYQWAHGPTSENLTDLAASSEYYKVTVTDANSCTAVDSGLISEPDPITVTINKQDPLCNGSLTGIATANASGGIVPYEYVWNDPGNQTEQQATALPAGTYTVTVTDFEGCLETATTTLNDPAPIEITNVNVTDISCNGYDDGAISVDVTGGTGAYDFNWNHTSENTSTVSALSPGNYSVSVTDANNCPEDVAYASIIQPDPIVIDTLITHVDCYGATNGEIQINATGGSGSFTYTWAHTASGSNNLTGLAAGTYQVTVSDGSCDPFAYSIDVNQPEQLSVTTDKTDPVCHGNADGIISLTVTGGTPGYSYAWNHSALDTNQFDDLTAGDYSVTVTDLAGCTEITTVTLNDPAPVEILSMDVGDVDCNGYDNGTISVDATGGTGSLNYNWSHSAENNSAVSGLSPGDYTVTVADVNMCSDTAYATIVEPDTVMIDITTTDIDCFGQEEGEIIIDASGGSGTFTYDWAHTTSGFDQLGGLAAGTYDVTVSDGQCPPFEYSIDITQPDEINVTIDVLEVSCHGEDDGEITVNATGGSGNFSYTWNHSAVDTNRFTNLTAGNYAVTVSDGSCPPLNYSDLIIPQPDSFYISSVETTDVTSAGAEDGSITVNVSGGIPPLRFSLDGGIAQESNTFNDLAAGIYTVVINDAEQCGPLTTGPVEITEPTSGIFSQWLSNEVSLYPNPADEEVSVKFNNIQHNAVQVKIVNMLGEIVFDKTYRDIPENNLLKINTQHIDAGAYFIVFNNKRAPYTLIIK